MYFASRKAAGEQLASRLEPYASQDVAILALSEGGVVVGAQIAARLHCSLAFLLTQDITLPGERTAVGIVDQNGGFTYNDYFSTGEIDELATEYHAVIDSLKEEKWHEMNRLLADGGLAEVSSLENKVIILVSDGLLNGSSLIATMNFLKPIAIEKVIIATPVASVAAVDKMHLLGDELQVLQVVDGVFDLDHYYDENDVPERPELIKVLTTVHSSDG